MNLVKFALSLLVFSVSLFAGPAQIDATKTLINANCDATGHHFDAAPQKYDLILVFDENGEKPVEAKLHFLLQDLKTGKDKRDIEMLHWLEAEQYPALDFAMTAYEGSASSGKIKGTLRLHNVSKEIEIHVQLTAIGNQRRIQGDFSLNYKDFALPFIRKMLVLTVDPVMKIHLDLVANH